MAEFVVLNIIIYLCLLLLRYIPALASYSSILIILIIRSACTLPIQLHIIMVYWRTAAQHVLRAS